MVRFLASVALGLCLARAAFAQQAADDVDRAADFATAGLAQGSSETVRVSLLPLEAPGVDAGVAGALSDAIARRLASPPFELMASTSSRADFTLSGRLSKSGDGLVLALQTVGEGPGQAPWRSVVQIYLPAQPSVAAPAAPTPEPPPVAVSTAPAAVVPVAAVVAVSTVAVETPPPDAWLGAGVVTPNGALGYRVDVTLRDPRLRWQAGGEAGGAVHKDFDSGAVASRFSTIFLRARGDALFPFRRFSATAGLGLGVYRTQEDRNDSAAAVSTSADHDSVLPSIHAGLIWPLGARRELRAGVEYILRTRALGTAGYRFGGVGANVSLGLQL